ncbi:MAG TPA: bifunctional methylenetetrahydrofolate dehydrogenase/methenyltetrahydrofolate cyclohydrolase FolD [Geminicoccaceae bacterium]|nr:bifunctional methylenetetrahydrofolate dehydrogenase/methenyltetrahydrofolate cyclohydrolase FolD [Geminicoccaceae bacterium]
MSRAQIIDGKALAVELRAEIREQAAAFRARHGVPPGLRVVLVGDHPASRAYVRTKARVAREIGIDGALIELPADISESDLLAQLAALNDDPAVHGILVQLPLPAQIDDARVLEALDPAKDVDGFHPINVGRLFSAGGPPAPSLLVPCTPMGCMILLRRTLGEDLAGRQALVIGRSSIVGKPVAALLLAAHCTVTVAHSRTLDLPEECRRAEILVAAVGRPHLIHGDWIRPGATVIDVGIVQVPSKNGKMRLVGDVAFEEAAAVAGAITPVPGGVGPMTVACLMRNTLIAARNQLG